MRPFQGAIIGTSIASLNHYDKAIISVSVDQGDANQNTVVVVGNDPPSLISILRSDESIARRADTTIIFYTHKKDTPMSNISSSIVVCCFTSLSFFDTTPSNLKKNYFSKFKSFEEQDKNAEPTFLSLSFLHESALVGFNFNVCRRERR